jgi:2-oxoglutarate ferredoxin oxidoreductase subunit beta
VALHDGSRLRLRKLEEGYDPRDRGRAVARLLEAGAAREVLTGLLYVEPGAPALQERLGLVDAPLATLPEALVRPPPSALDEVMESLR